MKDEMLDKLITEINAMINRLLTMKSIIIDLKGK